MLTGTRRGVVAITVLGLAFAAALLSVSVSAEAEEYDCVPPDIVRALPGGAFECITVVTDETPGPTAPGGGDSGPAEPTCNLAAAPAPSAHIAPHVLEGPYCSGTRFCVTTELVIPFGHPEGDRPTEDSEARYRFCSSGGNWSLESSWWTGEDEPPSLLERARSAIGRIDLATPTLNTSPSGRTLVGLDTWFWAAGASTTATGSALDLVATATFRSMSIDPGDGAGAITCPLTTTRAAARSDCRHTYRRASLGGSATVGGRPAHSASVRLVYDVNFTVGGNPITVPGAPTTMEAPAASAVIRVDEVQSIVTEVD